MELATERHAAQQGQTRRRVLTRLLDALACMPHTCMPHACMPHVCMRHACGTPVCDMCIRHGTHRIPHAYNSCFDMHDARDRMPHVLACRACLRAARAFMLHVLACRARRL
eukprot:6213263-Pleurochrysis_carterae.AAC.2